MNLSDLNHFVEQTLSEGSRADRCGAWRWVYLRDFQGQKIVIKWDSPGLDCSDPDGCIGEIRIFEKAFREDLWFKHLLCPVLHHGFFEGRRWLVMPQLTTISEFLDIPNGVYLWSLRREDAEYLNSEALDLMELVLESFGRGKIECEEIMLPNANIYDLHWENVAFDDNDQWYIIDYAN